MWILGVKTKGFLLIPGISDRNGAVLRRHHVWYAIAYTCIYIEREINEFLSIWVPGELYRIPRRKYCSRQCALPTFDNAMDTPLTRKIIIVCTCVRILSKWFLYFGPQWYMAWYIYYVASLCNFVVVFFRVIRIRQVVSRGKYVYRWLQLCVLLGVYTRCSTTNVNTPCNCSVTTSFVSLWGWVLKLPLRVSRANRTYR